MLHLAQSNVFFFFFSPQCQTFLKHTMAPLRSHVKYFIEAIKGRRMGEVFQLDGVTQWLLSCPLSCRGFIQVRTTELSKLCSG